MLYYGHQINWSACRRAFISSASHPPNIGTLVAPRFDSTTLEDARAMIRDRQLQVVHIETPYSEQAQRAGEIFASSFRMKVIGDVNNPNVDLLLAKAISRQEPHYPELANLSQESKAGLIEIFAGMINATKGLKKHGALSSAGIYTVEPNQRLGFHTHPKDPTGEEGGLYLNTSLGDETTVFLDSRELAPATLFNPDLDCYSTPTPTLWCGKPGSYFLFTVGEHTQGRAKHSSPVSNKYRGVPIISLS